MEYLCTTCCKEKRDDETLLPAARRYLSPRIDAVLAKGAQTNKPVVILSGKFGLLGPDDPIPHYDLVLEEDDVPAMRKLLVGHLKERGVSRLIFYGPSLDTPGWGPYYHSIMDACSLQGVHFTRIPAAAE